MRRRKDLLMKTQPILPIFLTGLINTFGSALKTGENFLDQQNGETKDFSSSKNCGV